MFALILTGNALAPRFRHGDALAIDPDREAKAGDAVLASFDGNPDRRGVMLLNADGDLTDSRGAFVPAGFFTVEGVVVGSDPSRPETGRGW